MFSIFSKKITKYLLKKIKEVDIISKNNKATYIFLSVTLLCILIIGIYFLQPSGSEAAFTLKEYDGRLGIFIGTANTPSEIINIDFRSLPEADQIRLKDGITVYSKEELHSLTEDFS